MKNAFLLLLRRYFNVVKYEDETFPRQFLKPARNKAGSLSIYFFASILYFKLTVSSRLFSKRARNKTSPRCVENFFLIFNAV